MTRSSIRDKLMQYDSRMACLGTMAVLATLPPAVWLSRTLFFPDAIIHVPQVDLWPILQISSPTVLTDAAVVKFIITVLSLLSLGMIFLTSQTVEEQSRGRQIASLVLVVYIGALSRLIPAFQFYGNYDMESYEIVSEIVMRGGNVYAETARYNYSPAWFLTLGLLKHLQIFIGADGFYFVVKAFLCLVDLLTLVALAGIAASESRQLFGVAVIFYLNPVSFLITGYHGQFENCAILPVLVGIFIYTRLRARRPRFAGLILWMFGTLAFIVKHVILSVMVVTIRHAFDKWSSRACALGLTAVFFALTLVPYWSGAQQGIIKNVIQYSGVGGYGMFTLLDWPGLKYFFIVGLFVFPLMLKGDDIVHDCLMATLFFLSFTTGLSIQQLVLPVALSALRPSLWARLYSAVTTLVILAHNTNLGVPIFFDDEINLAWYTAFVWFAAEIYLMKAVKPPTESP